MSSGLVTSVVRGGLAPRGERRPLRGTLTLALVLVLAPSLVIAAEPPWVPASFAEVAAGALAASFVIRAPAAAADAEDSRSVQSVVDPDDVQENGTEPVDPLAALRDRTLGAGVVIDPRGLALTSARVVLRARDFELSMMDGTPMTATVIGIDLPSDVAVLRLAGRGAFFHHLPLADSGAARVGDWVISVGAPLGLDGTVVAGVITAVPGEINTAGNFIQTDAMMARGNAGGPLVDVNGRLVGIGTLAAGDGSAYAIPARTLRRITRALVEKGRVSRPWLGVTSQSLNPALARALGASDPRGALIADVDPSGPAAGAGARPGDIVVGIGSTTVVSRLEFERAVSALVPGDVVTLTLTRAGLARTVAVRLGEDPHDLPLPPAGVLARRRLGIEVGPVNPPAGAVARDVSVRSSAARAGIRSGDVIRELDGRRVETPTDFEAAARAIAPGTPVLMRVQRGNVVLYVVVTADR